ncbi:NIPSNAP family protein [Cupriavidus necator]|uniref:NIPSNAP family protein n=1 Tax=Cupriavidus necator TaxID=106590 RepID=A0A1U9UMY1_CUPNE|nr:NIPSNAP family protein [Cupriavidus necator]AQV94156.1 NIPSNAP family protein [Cupriavidus necator]
MIVEQRIYSLKAGKVREFLAVYEAEGLVVQAEALGRLLGYFTTETGELNQVVQLWGFDSFEERLRRRAALSAQQAWHAFLQKAGPLVLAQKSELLLPAPFSPIR